MLPLFYENPYNETDEQGRCRQTAVPFLFFTDSMSKGVRIMAKIACVQMNCEKGKISETTERMVAYVREAAANGAELVILPEGIYQGYVFESYEELYPLAEEVPAGTISQTMIRLAKELKVYIIWGMYEKCGIRLYNSAVLVGPEGHVGTYRKMHYWETEARYCEPSDSGFPVYDTALGKIAIIICYDLWFPESSRIAVLQGADLIVTPTGWVKMESVPDPIPGYPAANVLCIATAHTNGVCVAASARVGSEGATNWVGHSLICAPSGQIVARAGDDREEIIYAELDLRKTKETRMWGKRCHILANRRTDYYDETLGYDCELYPM